MHKKADAKEAIERLAIEWSKASGYRPKPGWYPSFYEFKIYLAANGHTHYLNFRSSVDAETEAEGWFESAIAEHWRFLATQNLASDSH